MCCIFFLFSTEPVIKVEYQFVGFADNFNILDENITAIKGTQTLL